MTLLFLNFTESKMIVCTNKIWFLSEVIGDFDKLCSEMIVIINCQRDVVNGYEPDQTASYNQFEPGLNRSIQLQIVLIRVGVYCRVSCYIDSVPAIKEYQAYQAYPKHKLEDFENASPYFCTFLANRICD